MSLGGAGVIGCCWCHCVVLVSLGGAGVIVVLVSLCGAGVIGLYFTAPKHDSM